MTELRTALESILSVIKHELPMDFWMVTRVVDNDWIMVSTSQNNYGVKDDDVVDWSTSICSRMVKGEGPNIAPDVKALPQYDRAPITGVLDIGAYVGYPLKSESGDLMGTLCAIDPKAQDKKMNEKSGLMNDFVTVVEALMQQGQEITRLNTIISDYVSAQNIDPDIGLPDEQAFLDIAQKQKAILKNLGSPLAFITVELQNINEGSVPQSFSQANAEASGERLKLLYLKALISEQIRAEDVLCKLEGSQFGVLLMNTDKKALTKRVVNLLKSLQKSSYKAKVGAHVCGQQESVEDAIASAKSRAFA